MKGKNYLIYESIKIQTNGRIKGKYYYEGFKIIIESGIYNKNNQF